MPDEIDWDRFFRLIRRHRVEGLAYAGLGSCDRSIPDHAAVALREASTRILQDNLRIAHECDLLLTAFRVASIPVLFLKGLALAAQVYANPFLKQGWDIDLLVAHADLSRAAAALSASGYQPQTAPLALGRWHNRRKESVWSKDGQFFVELHTRLADNPALLGAVAPFSDPIEVGIPGGSVLPTLGGDGLFAYLCVHGTGSGWSRMKWLADLAALLRNCGEAEIERLYRRSVKLGAGRCAAPALLLAHRDFGTKVSAALRKELRASTGTRLLTGICTSYLRGRFELVEPTEVRGGTIGIHFLQILLAPSAAFAAAELGRQAIEIFTREADGRGADGNAAIR